MIFSNRTKVATLAVFALFAIITACEKDPVTLGSGVIGSEAFTTDRAVFDVFADNKKIRAVRTGKLQVYQLGIIDHPVYGTTEARVTSQVQLSSEDPSFGDSAEADEATSEEETVQSVVLYIPFLTNPSDDADEDGLPDIFETEEGINNPPQ